MTRYRVHGVEVPLDAPEGTLSVSLANKLGLKVDDLTDVRLVKRSLDARKRKIHGVARQPGFVCSVDVTLPASFKPKGEMAEAPDPFLFAKQKFKITKESRVVVVGAGPSGLFAANAFAENGVKTILVDRGQPVEVRAQHVSRLMHHGELIPDSNICFGEGGAGTWSDGKLYTRVNDPKCRQVLETIVELGGPERILVDGKPHLGTDRLVRLCKAFRARLTELGAEVRFGATVSGLILQNGSVKGVTLVDGERIEADKVLLCLGHSARAEYEWLLEAGVAMQRKPFAVGFRVEHKQAQVNEIQYGEFAKMEGIPTADYKVTANFGKGEKHVGVYSFCMCPGGQVVPSPTQPGGVCINGMSHASRRGHYANSALVVSVRPEHFDSWGVGSGPDLLAGVRYQRKSEEIAYELGGGGFIAPAQRLADFVAGTPSSELLKTTYKPGVGSADLSRCYPDAVIEHLRASIEKFDRKMPGFLTNDALLVGVETRTSAPVQIERGERYESPQISGLYPVGEGAGYGGGIVSAAVDGLRVANAIMEELADSVERIETS